MQAFIQQVENSLLGNRNLKQEAKNELFVMVKHIYQKMYQMGISIPKDLLIERLKTVSLEEGQKFVNREIYHYDMNANKVSFDSNKINEQNEANLLCQAILSMSYLKKTGANTIGIDEQKFAALAKGTFEIYANNIVPNTGEIGAYEDEQVITNLMNDVTDGKILEAFIQADSQMLEEALKEHNLLTINSYANYNLVSHPIGLNSQLGEIEKQLVSAFFNNSPIDIHKNMDAFESHLVTKAEVMSLSSQYDFEKTLLFYNRKKQAYSYDNLENVIPFSKTIEEFIPEEATMGLYDSRKRNI